MDTISSSKILGVNVSTEKKSEILKKIIKSLKEGRQKAYIVTPNPEIIMNALRERSYMDILNRAQVSLPDGIGVLASSKLLKKGVLERITGVDMMVEIVRECAKEGLTTGFFGGVPGVAEKTADCLQKSYPNLKVAYADSDWDTAKIKGKHIDMLFVALGFPKQEIWISENLPKIPVTIAMGVGGSFDYISGRVKRAPGFLRSIGLEWAFRLVNEPWRVKRQIVLPKFAYLVLKEKLRSK